MESSTKRADIAATLPFKTTLAGVTQASARRWLWHLYVASLVVNDIVMAGLAFWLAYQVRFNLALPVFQLDVISSFPFYRGLTLGLIPMWLIVFAASGLYQQSNLLGGIQEYSLVFRATTVAMLLVVVAGFLEPDFILARGWLLLAWTFIFLLVALGRFWLRRLVYHWRKQGYLLAPALIVGFNEEGHSLAQQLMRWQTSGLHLLGFVDDTLTPGHPPHGRLSTLGGIHQLDELIERHGVEELILTTSALSRDEILAIFKRYGLVAGLNLRLSSGLYEVITTGLQIKEMAYVPLVGINKMRLTAVNRVLKLLLDYVIAIPSLFLCLPLLILIGLAIKLDSSGPVLHRRRVMGLQGKEFDAYKFRTMYTNGEDILAAYPELQTELAQQHKLKTDPRVTRVGRFLRQTSLDELPQFLNVLKREMSLVGPRIISPAEMAMYHQWETNLLTVHPGITGLWQVNGRSDLSYEERVRLDMHYIRNWNIWMDLQILLQTIPVVLRRKGAY